MKIEMKKFGLVLTSRQSGKDSYNAFRPTLAEVQDDEDVIVDFSGIISLSPSWADEFLTPLQHEFSDKLFLENLSDLSVALTLETLEEVNGYKFINFEQHGH